MKKLANIFLLLLVTIPCFAQQKETFDLATYTIPQGWKKVNSSAGGVIGYAIINNQKGTYCQMAIYKSMGTMGNAQLDFETDWQDLVAKSYQVTAKPEAGPEASEDGWQAKSGTAPFDFSGGKSTAMLVTMSGYGKRVSIVILTNTQDYQTEIEKFLESVDLKKPEVISQQTNTNIPVGQSIIGVWVKSSGSHQSYGDAVSYGHDGYTKDQYTFNDNGTYNFVSKTFMSSFNNILLVKENGVYQISGNNITINPQKSMIESWSKKNGTDKFGDLISTQNRTLEKTTYQFTHHYFSGIQEWNLVLQSPKPTEREGPYSTNTTFANAWYYRAPSSNNLIIQLP